MDNATLIKVSENGTEFWAIGDNIYFSGPNDYKTRCADGSPSVKHYWGYRPNARPVVKRS